MAERPLLFSSVVELGRVLRAGKASSVELTERSLAALDTRGRELNAVAELTRELAMREAEQADRELASGHDRGPLHGIPYGAKDLLATRGIPTRWGSPAHKDQVFDYDAAVIERLRAAGAVLVAKLAMIELAGGGGYDSPAASLHGPCLNPYNAGRWAGGSSSGSGAAVGGGLVGFAIGTETWGSITVPAAFCNVSGLRPTYGRVSRYGAMALSWTMDKIGAMARTAVDCALVLRAMAGHDPRDPSSAKAEFTFDGEPSHRSLRLGLLPTDFAGAKAHDAEKRFSEALDVLGKLGHRTAEAKLPDFPYSLAAETIITAEGASSFENLIGGPDLELLADETQKAGLVAGLRVPAADYLRAMRVRTLAAEKAVLVFERFDALVAPTLLKGAPPADRPLSEGWTGMGGNGGPGNLLGWPSLTVPMGPDSEGMPLGIEFIASPYDEATILSFGIAFQRQTDWHTQGPPLALTPPSPGSDPSPGGEVATKA